MIETPKLAPKRVVRVVVLKMLGVFDHDIEFPEHDEFVCIHGPNGVGKTKLLELLDATLHANVSKLFGIQFETFRIEFHDNTWIHIEQKASSGGIKRLDLQAYLPEMGTLEFPEVSSDVANKALNWLNVEGFIRRRRMGSGYVNIDPATDQVISDDDAIETYMSELPEEVAPVPQVWAELSVAAPARLIEIGRLRETSVQTPIRQRLGESSEVITAIERCAQDLASRNKGARAAYSVKAQSSDRSYAIRLIEEDVPQEMRKESDLRERYDSVINRQNNLSRLSLLGSQDSSIRLPAGQIEPWQKLAIGLHLSDLEEKLATFDEISKRMQAFQKIVNGKLSGKRLEFDSDRGFLIVVDRNSLPGEEISINDLSSGESHLIVIVYRLLFETRQGELVLIDEPEISWHIAWQRQFLDDLIELSRLNGLRFVVATHSPQIVGRWTKRMQLLEAAE